MKKEELIPDVCTREDIDRLYQVFTASGYQLYPVGGCVRDAVAGTAPHDYDLCTNAVPARVIQILQDGQIPFHAPGIDFGTVIADVRGNSYEITSFRSEREYTDGRHPGKIVFEKEINKDLSRRDFTINAMAYDLQSETVIDPFNGISDLQNGIIKCVGDPFERFQEDGLRIVRALRFAIRYGADFDGKTAEAIHENLGMMQNVSKERILMEFRKILSMDKPVSRVFVEYADVITCLIPELKSCVHFNQNNRYHKHDVYEHLLAVTDLCQTTKFEIKMAALLHDIGKPDSYMEDENGHGHFYGHPAVSAEIAKGVLKTDFKGLKTEEYDHIVALVKTHDKSISSSRKSVKRFIAAHGADFLDDWAVLKKADFDDHIFPSEPPKNWFTDIPEVLKIRDELVAEETCFSLKDLAVNGKDLMKELGLKPGKKIGDILQQMLEAVLNETAANDREELLSLAQKLI